MTIESGIAASEHKPVQMLAGVRRVEYVVEDGTVKLHHEDGSITRTTHEMVVDILAQLIASGVPGIEVSLAESVAAAREHYETMRLRNAAKFDLLVSYVPEGPDHFREIRLERRVYTTPVDAMGTKVDIRPAVLNNVLYKNLGGAGSRIPTGPQILIRDPRKGIDAYVLLLERVDEPRRA